MKYPPRRAATCGCGYLAAILALLLVASLQIHHHHHHLKVDLGRADFDAATATQRRRQGAGRWSRRTGAEGLPRGIVETSSDMYLRPLWDNSASKTSASKNKNERYKALLAMAVGIEQMQNVDTMARKFLNESYTVMLFHYDGNVDGWRGLEWSDKAIHVLAPNQTKWWFAKRFLHPSVVAVYDFIFLWDEDLGVEKFDPRRYLDIMVAEGLEITQPALDPDLSTDIHHRITIRNKMTKVHRRVYDNRSSMNCSDDSKGPPCTGWVEGMAPVFSRAAWKCVWHLIQNDLIHGWGLDMKLGYCAQGDRAEKVGVIDSEYVVHQGIPSLGGPSHTSKVDLGRADFDAATATQRRRQGAGRWSRRTGAEGLPRGIVETSSDMYLRPLWDNSASKTSASKNKNERYKALLAMAVGIEQMQNVDTMARKFLNESYTVMLFHYDGNVDGWRGLEWSDKAIHVLAPNQTKWWFAKRFLHPSVVAVYDFIFLWDEDLGVEKFDPRRYLDIMVAEGLEITQPALDPDLSTDIHHRITIRNKMTKVHRRVYDNRSSMNCSDDSKGPPCTGWVEGMAPVFSRAAWKCVWHLIQNDLIHGWGLDMKLGYCAQGDRAEKVGVIDSEYVVHQGIPSLGGPSHTSKIPRRSLDLRTQIRRKSSAELETFKERWDKAVREDDEWMDPFEA